MTAMLQERDYMLDELGDPNAPVGSRLWSLWVANELRKALDRGDQIEQTVRDLTSTLRNTQAWQELGCLTWEQFCERYLHRPSVQVDKALYAEKGLRDGPGAPVGNRNAAENNHNNSNNCFRYETPAQGNSADYLTARIQRDNPTIYERLRRGEYRSVRAAAIDAGIVKPTVRYSLPSDPEAAGRYLAERVDEAWFIAVADAFYKGK